MSYLNFIQSKEAWEEFHAYEFEKEYQDADLLSTIESIIDSEEYKEYDRGFMRIFAIPRLVKLSEYNTSKKRIVYVYPEPHRTVLKLIGYYLLKNYNEKFCRNSLAYTKGRSVKSAFRLLDSYKIKSNEKVYKNDFSDYFNSIDLDLLDKKLSEFLKESDYDLQEFIMTILRQPRVVQGNKIVLDHNKGVMAGSPIAGILANIFMHEVDESMLKNNFRYIRYADDTLIVGEEALEFFKKEISKAGITLNPKKMKTMTLKEGIDFLGFIHKGKSIDISEKALAKMKSRFKRRAKWYRRWMLKNNVKTEVALRDYIRKINFKLYSDQEDSINWSRWYLPNINTTKSIKYLDLYFVNCIRYLDSGTWHRGKKFYSLSYKEIKNLGYRSLINEYYRVKKSSKRAKVK